MRESEGLYRWFRFLKRALAGLVIIAVGVMVIGYALFTRRVDARGAWEASARELNGGMLRYGERIERWAKAFQRRPTDYYRATNGLLVATNDRVIFIGISPPDKLANEDAPATILQYEFPNDTLLSIREARLYFLTAEGVRISHPERQNQEIAASPGEEATLEALVQHVSRRLAVQKAAAARERRLRAAVDAMIREPIYYVVRRGDALSSIAKRFDATPEEIRAWNNLPTDRVRIGERLVVKPQGLRRR